MARILIIDDEEVVRMAIRKMLELAGYEVVEAPDGEQGVQLYRQAPADLVITDIQMPRKNGLEVIQELRHDFPKVKIITITGQESEALSIANQLDVRHIFTKPFRMHELLKAVEELLEEVR